MRTLVLVLMLALLPLRMWAAEGMAVRMAQQEVAAVGGHFDRSSMPEDCPMVAGAQADADERGEQPLSATHCMACHLCAATAGQPGFALEQGLAPTGPPVTGSSRYANAELERDLRPPIA